METPAPTTNKQQNVDLENAANGRGYSWQVMAVVIFGTFMAILDSTAVNVAIPTLRVDFNAQVDQINAVLTSYILALGIITPLAGWLAERFGIKCVFLIA